PGVIVGASILLTYLVLPVGIYNTIWILLVAYVTLYLPYGMRFASSGLTQIHRELEEAGAGAGARPGQIFRRIPLPLLAPVLLSAWIYVFVLSVRELGASVFLVGPGTHVLGTISLTMWEEGGSYGAVSALGILQIVPLLCIVAALRWLETRVHRRIAPPRAADIVQAAPPASARAQAAGHGRGGEPAQILPGGAARRGARGRRHRLRHRERTLSHAARTVGLRQDHDAAVPGRVGAAGCGPHRARRYCRVRCRGGRVRAGERARHRHGFSVLCDLAAH